MKQLHGSANLLTRGQLAKLAGVNLETIRFYESKGLLPKPARSTSGYRLYPREQLRRLGFIRRAQELGFTLNEVKELLSLKASPNRSSLRVKRLAENKISSITEKIRDLRKMLRILEEVTKACDGCGSTSDCPILNVLDGKETVKGIRS